MCISHIQRPFNLLIPSQVVYFGDSMHSDIFPAHHYSNWETVFILEELLGDKVMVPAETESEPLEKKGKYEVSVPFRYFLEQKRASYRKASCLLYQARGCLSHQAAGSITHRRAPGHHPVPAQYSMGATEPSLP